MMTDGSAALRPSVYRSLQAGRALAALMVVLYHIGTIVKKYFGIRAAGIPFLAGDSGVAFFFVLSGFIIFSAHWGDLSSPSRLPRYLWKRGTRIYPVFWIVFLAVYGIALATPWTRETVPHGAAPILKALLLLPQDRSIAGAVAPVIIVAWTLHYEMLFYVSFALLVVRRWLAVLPATGFLTVWLLFKLGVLAGFPWEFLAYDGVWCFLFGIGVALVTRSRWAALLQRRAIVFVAAGLAVWAAIALRVMVLQAVYDQEPPPNAGGGVAYGACATLVVLGLVLSEQAGRPIGSHRTLQLLGDASYALYLVHAPVLSILLKLMTKALHVNRFGAAGAAASAAVLLAASLSAGVGFHLAIERPIGRLLNPSRGKKR